MSSDYFTTPKPVEPIIIDDAFQSPQPTLPHTGADFTKPQPKSDTPVQQEIPSFVAQLLEQAKNRAAVAAREKWDSPPTVRQPKTTSKSSKQTSSSKKENKLSSIPQVSYCEAHKLSDVDFMHITQGMTIECRSFKPLTLANGGEKYVRDYGMTLAQAYDNVRREIKNRLLPQAGHIVSHRVPEGWRSFTPGMPTTFDRIKLHEKRQAAEKIAKYYGIKSDA